MFRKGVEKVLGRRLEGVGKVSGKHWAGCWAGVGVKNMGY